MRQDEQKRKEQHKSKREAAKLTRDIRITKRNIIPSGLVDTFEIQFESLKRVAKAFGFTYLPEQKVFENEEGQKLSINNANRLHNWGYEKYHGVVSIASIPINNSEAEAIDLIRKAQLVYVTHIQYSKRDSQVFAQKHLVHFTHNATEDMRKL